MNEELICVRCGNKIEDKTVVNVNEDLTENTAEGNMLCTNCKKIVEEALQLIETNKNAEKYLNQIISKQEQASVRLEKLKYRYYNESGFAGKMLKKAGRTAKKVWDFNVLDVAIKSTKNILKTDNTADEEMSEEERLVNEIIDLEEFVDTDPIEFVIYEYITLPQKDSNEDIKKKRLLNDINVGYKELFTSKFLSFNKKTQLILSISFLVFFLVAFILISLS